MTPPLPPELDDELLDELVEPPPEELLLLELLELDELLEELLLEEELLDEELLDDELLEELLDEELEPLKTDAGKDVVRMPFTPLINVLPQGVRDVPVQFRLVSN